jgi:hypothetical protein
MARNRGGYTKTSGYNFQDCPIKPAGGMLTLGTNEQIELRDLVQVELDEMSTNLY